MWTPSFTSSMTLIVVYCYNVCLNISLRRPSGTEPEFFVQLFVEFDENLKVPTIETLLVRMFREMHISFSEVSPSLSLSLLCQLVGPTGAIQTPGTGPKVWQTVPDIQEDCARDQV